LGGFLAFADSRLGDKGYADSGPRRGAPAVLVRRIASRRARAAQPPVKSQSRIRNQLSRVLLTIAINPELHSGPIKVPYYAAVPTINSEKVALYPSLVLEISRDGLRGRRPTAYECAVLIVCLDVLSARFATGSSYNNTLLICGGQYCKRTERS
jgi:hypothetical protein